MTTPEPEKTPASAIKDKIKEGKEKIESEYDRRKEKRRPLEGTNLRFEPDRAAMADTVAKMFLKHPLEAIESAVAQEQGKSDTEIREKYIPKIDEAIAVAEAYLNKMTKETGGEITAKVLAKITESINQKASIYADLLASGKNQKLVEAFKASLGMQVNSGSVSDAVAASRPVLIEYIKKEFPKGDKGLMPCVWMIMANMSQEDRKEIVKKLELEDTEKFLREGNKMGVFGPDEMEEIQGKKYDKPEDRAELALNWKLQNDFSKQARQLLSVSYGTVNMAGEMLTLKNIGLFLAKLAAGTTVAANAFIGIWKAKAWQSPAKLAKVLTTPHVLGGAAIYGGIKVYEKGPKQKEKEQASIRLRNEKKGNPLWPKWDAFFTSQTSAGGQVFTDYIRIMKRGKEEIPENLITVAGFKTYLEGQAKRQVGRKKTERNVDYEALKKTFEGELKEATNEKMLTFAKIFDELKLGGDVFDDNYRKAVRQAGEKA